MAWQHLFQSWQCAAAIVLAIAAAGVLSRRWIQRRLDPGTLAGAARRRRVVGHAARLAAAAGPVAVIIAVLAAIDRPGVWLFWALVLVPAAAGLWLTAFPTLCSASVHSEDLDDRFTLPLPNLRL